MKQLLKETRSLWNKQADESGNTTVISLMLVMLILVFGGAFLLVVNLDFNSAYGGLLKSKSKTLVSYSVDSYKEHIASEIENSEIYNLNSLSLTDISPQTIPADPNYIIHYPSFSSTTTLWDTEYSYLSSKNISSNFATFSKNPDITQFRSVELFDTSTEDFNSSIDSIYNEGFKTNEFFFLKSRMDEPNQLIKIYSYLPSTDGDSLDTPLLTITQNDLENLTGTEFELDIFDDIPISAVWDPNIKSPYILFAVTEKRKKQVHYFRFIPINYGSSDKDYLEHIQTLHVTEGEILNVELSSSFSKDLNVSLFATSILVEEDANSFRNITYFSNLLEGTDKFKLNGDVIEYASNSIRSMSLDSFYDTETNSWNLHWATLEDSDNLSSNQIKWHSFIYGVDTTINTHGSIDLSCDGGNSCLDGKLSPSDLSTSILADVNISATFSPHIKTGVAYINTIIKDKNFLESASDTIASIKLHTFESDKLNTDTLYYEIEELNSNRAGNISSSVIIGDIPDLIIHTDPMIIKDSYMTLQDVSELSVELWRGTELRSRTRIGFNLGVRTLTPIGTNINKIEYFDVNNMWVE